jgi:hypothetical protein
MATDADENFLWNQWDPEVLGKYEGQWIAFQDGRVLESHESLSELSERYMNAIPEGNGPLFAFVTFKVRA